jgi:ABC-2 type transport system permease protein
MSWPSVLGAAVRFELLSLRRSPGDLIVLATTPLLTVAFLAILRHAGQNSIQSYAVIAPAVMALWFIGVLVCGEIIDNERAGGTLELLLASPASLATVVFGRIVTVSVLSLISIVETWLVAVLGFGVRISVAHPLLFAATMLAGAAATAGWAIMMAGTFVLARSARLFQNSISYPVFVLGGTLVPVAILPVWLRWLSRVVYLSWTSDLLRDAVGRAAVVHPYARLTAVLGLGLAGFLAGLELLRRVSVRVRASGEAGLA